jgi:hypothetical protein
VDPIGSPAVGTFLAERFAGARVVTLADETHTFAHERPDEVASTIRSNLA